MNRKRPKSTLFPYTALFRSRVRQYAINTDCGKRESETGERETDQHSGAPVAQRGRDALVHGLDIEQRDRKSTRLNSSHRCLSYAVFCLKKKKNNVSLASDAI